MDILIGTFTMRPYVFAFFAAFLLACVPHVGWRRTLQFTAAGYLIAFVSEWFNIFSSSVEVKSGNKGTTTAPIKVIA